MCTEMRGVGNGHFVMSYQVLSMMLMSINLDLHMYIYLFIKSTASGHNGGVSAIEYCILLFPYIMLSIWLRLSQLQLM
ncbi:hypothetical protein GGS21DRAFT_529302, partial [Xylaria nigripes]